MDNYVDINVPKRGFRSEEREKEPKDTIEIDDLDDVGDEGHYEEIEEEADEAPVARKPVAPPQAPKPPRSEKRIKQLLTKVNEKDREIEELNRKLFEAQMANATSSKGSKEALKQALTDKMEVIKQRLKTAIIEGVTDDIINLQDDLQTTKIELMSLLSDLENAPAVPEKYEPVRKQPQVAERALEWVEEHPEFKKDEIFYAAAMAVNQRLLSEGFDPQSEDFYEELDTRLAPRFPELFGVQKKSVVKSRVREEEILDEGTDETPSDLLEDQEEEEAPRPKQTVSSASRSSKGIKPSKPSDDEIKLTRKDIQQADRWNMTPVQIARRMDHIAKNRSPDGYAPIVIPTKNQ